MFLNLSRRSFPHSPIKSPPGEMNPPEEMNPLGETNPPEEMSLLGQMSPPEEIFHLFLKRNQKFPRSPREKKRFPHSPRRKTRSPRSPKKWSPLPPRGCPLFVLFPHFQRRKTHPNSSLPLTLPPPLPVTPLLSLLMDCPHLLPLPPSELLPLPLLPVSPHQAPSYPRATQ